ncbi:MAG: hypothetical protein ACOCTI_07175, partial [Phycisphaeraceae bacterium]
MPITKHDPLAQPRSAGPEQRMLDQQRQRFLRHQAAQLEADQQGVGWGRAWSAQTGMTLTQSLVNSATRRLVTEGDEEGFNPFTYIKERPELRDDPAIRMMVEMGQFDRSTSEDEFWFDHHTGQQYLDDADALERTSWSQYLATLSGTMYPEVAGGFLVGLGPSFAGARTLGAGVSATSRIANPAVRLTALTTATGATGLTLEEMQNQMTPVSDTPGPVNEAMAFTLPALLVAGIGLLASPAVLGRGQKLVSTRKVRRLRKDMDRLFTEPTIRPARVERGGATRPGGPDVAMGATQAAPDPAPQRLDLESMDEVYQQSRWKVERELERDPVDDTIVSIISRRGDENEALLNQLRQKYDEAGKTLHVVDHPDQPFYDLAVDAKAIMDDVGMSMAADAGDLDAGALDAAVMSVTTRYAKLQERVLPGGVTPAGRLADNTIGRIQDANRLLNGSAQTVTRAQARNWRTNESSESAESILGVYEGWRDNTAVSNRHFFRQGKREGMTYNGQPVKRLSQFNEAVSDLMRRENARARGWDVPDPDDVSPSVRQAAKTSRAFYLNMRDELEKAGLLDVGPRALRRAEQDVDSLRTKLDQAKEGLALARSQRQADLFNQDRFTQADVQARLDHEIGSMPTAIEQADTVLESLANDPDAASNLPSQFAILPDDLDALSPAQRARVAQRVPVTEDAYGVREALGDRLYEQAIAEVLGGQSGRRRNLVDGLLASPEGADPERVLDAWLFKAQQGMDPDEVRAERAIIDPAELPENTTVRVFGED